MIADPFKILKRHIVTERTTSLKEANSDYVFEVDKAANKLTVKQAVEKAFGVKVDHVRTMIVAGKVKRMGRYEGKTSTWKKAIVRLKDKHTIIMFENM